MKFTLENIKKLLSMKDRDYSTVWVEVETNEFGNQYISFNIENYEKKFKYFKNKINEKDLYIIKIQFF
ncbi:hypothetical protein ACV3Z5_14180 [Clostridium perfringens]